MENLHGYTGLALEVLKKADVKIGDSVQVIRDGEIFEGILMPRIGLGDPSHIILKLPNGYNVGIKVKGNVKVEKIEIKKKLQDKVVSVELSKKEDLPPVLIIGTGGTIASKVEYRTGAVYPSLTTEDLYRAVPELSSIAKIKTNVLLSIFSENMEPNHWFEIAKAVGKAIVENDVYGIVVAHGTDTMGYTAAALSFALQNLPIPVVLVGSQRSSDRPSSDAALNLIGAVNVAAYAPFAEVVVAMHESTSDNSVLIHRGVKVRKCHTSRRDAFQSVNAKPLARVFNGEIQILSESYIVRRSDKDFKLKPDFEEKVALLKFHPGFNPQIIDWLVEKKYFGIVFEGTGLGHVSKSCFESIKKYRPWPDF
ncbi:MAG: Glu-tRNA(Gln) amidotransferase subunit GatD [Candidatus Bathyarchaeota archaeon]|nr:Glu-tRNA(Gln) amidotransferase subunit GatD [Candidatus Bathyarchaeota archaeon]